MRAIFYRGVGLQREDGNALSFLRGNLNYDGNFGRMVRPGILRENLLKYILAVGNDKSVFADHLCQHRSNVTVKKQ